MQIKAAHLLEQGQNIAVFGADSRDGTTSGRQKLLNDLVVMARTQLRWKVDKAALQFMEHGSPTFFGSPDLVRLLSNVGPVDFNRTITVP